jgi:hypothetical protein
VTEWPVVPGELDGLAGGRRAGYGVAVLLKIYTHCIDGQAAVGRAALARATVPPSQCPARGRPVPMDHAKRVIGGEVSLMGTLSPHTHPARS